MSNSFYRSKKFAFFSFCFVVAAIGFIWISTPKTKLVFRNYNTASKCILPDLNPFDPTIMQFAKKPSPLSCGESDLLIMNENGTLVIKSQSYSRNIDCTYSEVVRESDDIGVHFREEIKFTPPFIVPAEIFRVRCRNSDGGEMDKMFSKIFVNQTKLKTKILDESANRYSVLIFGLDSVSRLATIRQLPKTYKFLTENLGAHVFKGHMKVNENTFPNFIPLFTGKTLPELPTTEQQLDKFPLIWHNFSSSGYVTLFAEDWPDYNMFNYALKGFHDTPADHYIRPFWLGRQKVNLVSVLDPVFFFLEDKNINIRSSSLCYGDQAKHNIQMDYLKKFVDTYKGKRKFAFSFLNEVSHEYPRFLELLDKDIWNFLQQLFQSGELENSFLIFMSDHGSRNGDIRNTLIGKIEDNMPILAIRLPDKLEKKFPYLSEIMQENTRRLTTHFDTYETLKDILHGNYERRASPQKPFPRGISLMQPVPDSRSCEDAAVREHYCSCNEETPVDTNSMEIKAISEQIVSEINKILSIFKDKCEMLHLSKIISSRQISSGMKVIGKEEEGYFSFLKGVNLPGNEMKKYVIIVETLPSKGTFEAYVKTSGQKIEILGEILRTNRYGNQSACISDRLCRAYCFCKH